MSEQDHIHECDLFLLSSYHSYYANNILEEFASLGRRNVNGWGLASYDNEGRANILRSALPAFEETTGDLSREFYVASRAVSSALILGHLRLSSRGSDEVYNNHPFRLNFLENDWTLIHNGTARYPDRLVLPEERILTESDNDSARVFEFMRKKIIAYYTASTKKSIIEACRFAYKELISNHEGKFNIVISNGFISFVFIHFRPFYLLNREKERGHVSLLSTIKLTDGEEWLEINKRGSKQAKMLVFSGPLLIFNGDIPR